MKDIFNFLTALIFVLFLILIGIMRFFMLYMFSDLMYFILYHVFGYRKKVVYKNLKETFPDKSESEIKGLMKKSYKNLTDVLVEGIKAFTMTNRQIRKRHRVLNPELALPLCEEGKSIIGVAGHYCNWEWGSLSASLYMKHKVVGFYKPLSNRWIDRFARWSRARYGTTLASIKETSLNFERFKDCPSIFLMAADQSPSKISQSYWVRFLGRDTAFLHGPEKHARLNNIPVMFIDVQRVKRGYYTVEISMLANNPGQLSEGELTRLYAKKLESVIMAKPANWLWSHRRWKHKWVPGQETPGQEFI